MNNVESRNQRMPVRLIEGCYISGMEIDIAQAKRAFFIPGNLDAILQKVITGKTAIGKGLGHEAKRMAIPATDIENLDAVMHLFDDVGA